MTLKDKLSEAENFLTKIRTERTKLTEMEFQIIGRIQTYKELMEEQDAAVADSPNSDGS